MSVEDLVPWDLTRKWYRETASCKVDSRAGDGLGMEAHTERQTQRVVEKRPRKLRNRSRAAQSAGVVKNAPARAEAMHLASGQLDLLQAHLEVNLTGGDAPSADTPQTRAL